MRQTVRTIREAVELHPAYVVAVSGGTDSAVVLDLVARYAPIPPRAVLHVVTGLEPPDTLPHVRQMAARYGLPLHVAQASEAAPDLWQRRNLYPIAGKTAGRTWTRSHPGYGFKADPSSCCRAFKIGPGRAATKALGCTLQFTGLRGAADSASRGLHALKRGAVYEVDGLTICNPLTTWSDLRTASYIRRHALPLNPVTIAGGEPGCTVCYGGAQFTGSSPSRARRSHPDLVRRLLVDTGVGLAALAVKYGVPLSTVRAAVARLGGLDRLAAERPHVFDYIVSTPRAGYEKVVDLGPDGLPVQAQP